MGGIVVLWNRKRIEVMPEKLYRNEWKYRCTVNDLEIIKSRLETVLDKDIHSGSNGKYEIHSLYFDDYKDTCVRENDAGISERVKYRIRYYGSQCDFMKLERKEKYDNRCHKESCPISVEEYTKIVNGDADELLWETQKSLLKQFCVRCMTRQFIPKAIIDYERTAYVEELTNIRITLDENISVADDFTHFLDRDYIRYPVQKKMEHVLEVKFDYILPNHIKHIVTSRNLIQTSFSKYGLGRQKLQSMGR